MIREKNDMKNVAVVSAALSYERLAPHFQAAEEKYIIPLLGADMAKTLHEYYSNPANFRITEPNFSTHKKPDEATDQEFAFAVLLWRCQRASYQLGIFEGFDVLNVLVSDGGFSRVESNTQKPLFKYQENNLRKHYHENGMNELDSLLQHLESNILYFSEFAPIFNLNRTKLFHSTSTFNKHFYINNSRLVFLRLQPLIKTALELDVAPEIGTAIFQEIMSELEKPEPSARVMAIITLLRDATAHFAAARLMQDTGAELTERGLYFRSTATDGEVFEPSTSERVIALTVRNQQSGSFFLKRLSATIAVHWNQHTPSKVYVHARDNNNRRCFWA